jgi:CheY-like chemotaxis protein
VGSGSRQELGAPEDVVQESPEFAGRSLVVLAVDDDALVQMNTVAMLEDLGHTVVEASNGSEALEVLKARGDVQVVVTDFSMPKMTGGDLAAEIAKQWPDVPVILATGYAELPSGAQVDAVRLPKPFGQDELAKAIKVAMKG